MKIALLSDLHVDVSRHNLKILPWLAGEVADRRPDVLVLAGDIANQLQVFGEALSAFSALPCQKLLVPGNHDLWLESKRAVRRGEDSWWKYTQALPEICRDNGFACLPGAPLVIDGVGFAGSVGWYDFSLRDRRLDQVYSRAEYRIGQFRDERFPQGTWNDLHSTRWLRHPDSGHWRERAYTLGVEEVFEKILDLLTHDIEHVAGQVGKIVCVLHTNPFRECVPQQDPPDPFAAYAGSTQLGELLLPLALEKEVHVFCGHSHEPFDSEVSGIWVVRNPVGYLADFAGDYARKARELTSSMIIV